MNDWFNRKLEVLVEIAREDGKAMTTATELLTRARDELLVFSQIGPVSTDYASLMKRIDAYLASSQPTPEEVREACAKVCEGVYGGRAHTYASENADIYRAQDGTIASCVKAIRALDLTKIEKEKP